MAQISKSFKKPGFFSVNIIRDAGICVMVRVVEAGGKCKDIRIMKSNNYETKSQELVTLREACTQTGDAIFEMMT